MTTYRIVGGTLSVGSAGTLGIRSGGVMFDYPSSGWRAYLSGSEMDKFTGPFAECNLTVDLEGGGELRGICSLVGLGAEEAEVESDCLPEAFVEPVVCEPD